MDREIVLALVAIAPQVLVLLIIVIGALLFRGQIGKTIGGRVTHSRGPGLLTTWRDWA